MKSLSDTFIAYAVMEGERRVDVHFQRKNAEKCLASCKKIVSNGQPLTVVPMACKPLLPNRVESCNDNPVFLYEAAPIEIHIQCREIEDVEFAVINAADIEDAMKKVQDFIALIKAVEFEFWCPDDNGQEEESQACEETAAYL